MNKYHLSIALYGFLFMVVPTHASEENRHEKLYPQILANGLHIYLGCLKDTELPGTTIRGIDSSFGGASFAIGKFQFRKDITAYLTRRPEQYSKGKIELALFDTASGKKLTTATVASAGGEGGVWLEVESWFIDVDSDGNLDVVTKQLGKEGVCTLDVHVLRYSASEKKFIASAGNKEQFLNLQMRLGHSLTDTNTCINNTIDTCPPSIDTHGASNASKDGLEGLLIGDKVNLRASPVIFGSVLARLDKGTRVKVLSEDLCMTIYGKAGQWVKVLVLDNKNGTKLEGWIFDAYVQYSRK